MSIFKPQKFDIIFELHHKYSERRGFKEKFLEMACKRNIIFVGLLIDANIYRADDIGKNYGSDNSLENIIGLSKKMAQSTIDLTECIIETSYSPGTIEYCLKYDDIDEIHRIYQDPSFFPRFSPKY